MARGTVGVNMRRDYTLARLYVADDLSSGADVCLSPEQAHYLAKVLRLSVGAHLRVFNGRDGEWQADIQNLDKKNARLCAKSQLRPQEPSPDIWLCFALLKKQRNGIIAEKATELGVSRFQPIVTERTQFPKLRFERAHAQILEAAEQTERMDIPTLAETLTLDALIATWPRERILFFADEGGGAPPMLKALSGRGFGPSALLVGPEGGFNEKERNALRGQDFVVPVSLGPRILRADTAALSMLTLWQSVYEEQSV